jgi:hypothetical protein
VSEDKGPLLTEVVGGGEMHWGKILFVILAAKSIHIYASADSHQDGSGEFTSPRVEDLQDKGQIRALRSSERF